MREAGIDLPASVLAEFGIPAKPEGYPLPYEHPQRPLLLWQCQPLHAQITHHQCLRNRMRARYPQRPESREVAVRNPLGGAYLEGLAPCIVCPGVHELAKRTGIGPRGIAGGSSREQAPHFKRRPIVPHGRHHYIWEARRSDPRTPIRDDELTLAETAVMLNRRVDGLKQALTRSYLPYRVAPFDGSRIPARRGARCYLIADLKRALGDKGDVLVGPKDVDLETIARWTLMKPEEVRRALEQRKIKGRESTRNINGRCDPITVYTKSQILDWLEKKGRTLSGEQRQLQAESKDLDQKMQRNHRRLEQIATVLADHMREFEF